MFLTSSKIAQGRVDEYGTKPAPDAHEGFVHIIY
jgi:hypothetical protein